MGYDVAMMADSTSRWGEALREISGPPRGDARRGRLPRLPGHRVWRSSTSAPAACAALAPATGSGSVTVVGAVSPPGGDMSEPMTQNSLRVDRRFWALDTSLAHRRHFPAINWTKSYTLYLGRSTSWYGERRRALDRVRRSGRRPCDPPEGDGAPGDRPARRTGRPARIGEDRSSRSRGCCARTTCSSSRSTRSTRTARREAVPDAQGDPDVLRRGDQAALASGVSLRSSRSCRSGPRSRA